MSDNQDIRDVITKLLSTMAGAREIRQYLDRYASQEKARFAVVKVGGAVLAEDLPELAKSLAFLYAVGLRPIIIHGAGPQIDEAICVAGLTSERKGGLRVTTPEIINLVRRVMLSENRRFVDALQDEGAPGLSITSGVFQAERSADESLGLVGDVSLVHVEAIEAALTREQIPVLFPLAETADGQILNVNSDTAAKYLIRAMRPYKVVFLTKSGGLLDGEGAIVSSVNLASDYEELMAAPWLKGGMRFKIKEIKDILDKLPLASSVSMTRPSELTRELFTHQGAGTLLRRGENILKFETVEDIDKNRLKTLIEDAFSGPLDADYFDKIDLDHIWVTEAYRAAAVVVRGGPAPYLDKFAVAEDARGEGLGRTVWRKLCADCPRLFWRARNNNPIRQFYFEEADGSLKLEGWTMFWRGLEGITEIEACQDFARSRSATVASGEKS